MGILTPHNATEKHLHPNNTTPKSMLGPHGPDFFKSQEHYLERVLEVSNNLNYLSLSQSQS